MVTHLNYETSHGYPPLSRLWFDKDLGYWSVWYCLCGSHGLWHGPKWQVATIVSKVQITSIFSVEMTQFGRMSLTYIIRVEYRSRCRKVVNNIWERGHGGPGPDGTMKSAGPGKDRRRCSLSEQAWEKRVPPVCWGHHYTRIVNGWLFW
jgi:hypothetical protein